MPLGDCERILDGVLVQPVNALSSLAFVVAGLLVPAAVRRRLGTIPASARAFGWALALVGMGSVAFHGPAGSAAGWLHDASITALLLLVVWVEIGYRAGWNSRRVLFVWGGSAVLMAAAVAMWPAAADPLNAPLAFLAVAGPVTPSVGPARPPRTSERKGIWAGLVLLGLGAVVMLLSRTGAPLCDPDALLQGHAVWHLLAAGGIGVYAVAAVLRSEAQAPSRTHLRPVASSTHL